MMTSSAVETGSVDAVTTPGLHREAVARRSERRPTGDDLAGASSGGDARRLVHTLPAVVAVALRRLGGVEADANLHAGVAQVQRMRVSLRAVTDDRDLFALDQSEVRGIIVVEICHSCPLFALV